MKQVLKSLLTLTLVAVVAFGTTGAYFSSTVTAPDNQISTGTLRMAVDSTRAHSFVGTWMTGVGLDWDGNTVGVPFDAYNVVYDNNGVQTLGLPLEPWTNAAPGVYSPYAGGAGIETLNEGNHSVWMTVRNWGSVDAKALVSLTGEWTNLRATGTGGASCSPEGPGSDELIRLRNVHIYRTGSNNCENHEECRNLRNALNATAALPSGFYSYATDSDLSSAVNRGYDVALEGATFAVSSDADTTGAPVTLGQNQYVIARVDLSFDPTVVGPDYNCYQGATYLYDVIVDGTQVADPSW